MQVRFNTLSSIIKSRCPDDTNVLMCTSISRLFTEAVLNMRTCVRGGGEGKEGTWVMGGGMRGLGENERRAAR